MQNLKVCVPIGYSRNLRNYLYFHPYSKQTETIICQNTNMEPDFVGNLMWLQFCDSLADIDTT